MNEKAVEHIFDSEITIDNFLDISRQFVFNILPAHTSVDLQIVFDYVEKTFLCDIAHYHKVAGNVGDIDAYNISNSYMLAVLLFRIAHGLGKQDKEAAQVVEMLIPKLTGVSISLSAQIDEGFVLIDSINCKIDKNVKAGKNLIVFGNTVISDNVKQNKKPDSALIIGDNCTFYSCTVLGAISIGDNVTINHNCVVLEDIESGMEVKISNQLQLTENNKKNYLPSQRLIVYGIIPKFKNTLIIMGEGFYNPTLLIKIRDIKDLDYAITYWDKTKIIVKIKNTTPYKPAVVKNNKIIILSNNFKLIIVNSFALQSSLTTLK